ncbi:DUF1080 domain-containing protein [Shewanella sp. D64]|uniref:3-keto-disaccharide hydrolase n=1 Tax=unclassified Shewanella TaxID=196818 RepID=UPI0022BA3D31|nr:MULTISPECIES: DUF1080 domain-containing protein [unclassified Shewanella]MEC4725484.1 DUF1080 domain-containing protein [Shewanella sp. D64]MEC4738697.1 DUF1080 domain-containing protein [Shewanella sp. E94]WBJ94993.1 DUF1080 domain-containing protein [Shewanella sp. MTB7]
MAKQGVRLINRWQKLICALLFSTLAMASFAADNQLSKQEKEDGWQLLFNGKDMSQWRNFKQDGINPKWIIDKNSIYLSEGGGGDLLTKQVYQNFELTLEWKISSAGNSGIFVLADELGSQIYSHGIEVQIIDNQRHADNKIDSHLSGSLYDIVASPTASHRVAGEWNKVDIRLHDSVLTVWQNGVETADVVVGSDKWNVLVANSKFSSWVGFAQASKGHIGLQDHSDPVWFKNIKLKAL